VAEDLGTRRAGITIVGHASGGAAHVALTFDDCDDEGAWRAILDVLDAHDARATFFPSGMRVQEFPDTARATIARGHTVGSHSYSHARLTGLTLQEVQADLANDRRAWIALGQGLPRLFRPPYGSYDGRVVGAAALAGFSQLVLWDVDPLDWQMPAPDDIAERVLGAATSGSIVDLHVTRQTAAALGPIVGGLRRLGLEPITLGALLEA
jgi:peptidoglycan/xylan/chitin deacetylase (PgdA/CDA1 family)